MVRSRDLAAALTLLAVTLALAWQPQVWIGRWRGLFERLLSVGSSGEIGLGTPIFSWTVMAVAQMGCAHSVLALGVALLSQPRRADSCLLPKRSNPTGTVSIPPATSGTSFRLPGSAACCVRWSRRGDCVSRREHASSGLAEDRACGALRLPRTARATGLAAVRTRLEIRAGAAGLVGAGLFLPAVWNYEHSLRMTKQEVKAGSQGHRRQSSSADVCAACAARCCAR